MTKDKEMEKPQDVEVNEEKTVTEEKEAPVSKKEQKKETKKSAELEKKLLAAEEQNTQLSTKLKEQQDNFMRLMADFDNFRRHSAEDKLKLVSSASGDVIKGLLPVLDDFERALAVLKSNEATAASAEGVELIYNKLMSYLKTKGLEIIEAKGQPFDTDRHEAVAQFPVQDEQQKGKVFDVAVTGYLLNGEVLRYAKVVVGI